MFWNVTILVGDFIKEVNLVNFDSFDEILIKKVRDVAQPLLDKYNRMYSEDKIQEFKLVVDTVRKKQEKYLYEVIGTLKTNKNFFRTEEVGWKILDTVEKVIDELGGMVTKKKGRKKSKKNLPANA